METKDIIYELRTKKGLSQEELAEKIFVTRQAVSRWENGETIPNTETLKLLSQLFDVSINTLLGSPRQLICQCCGVKPRQHSLFWADGQPNRGTFHTNFVMDGTTATWIGLYDSGKKLVDQITIPAGTLKADQSYARISDASDEWEVKGESADKYVTPSTNNKTQDGNPKMEKFEQHDSVGIGMSITAMSVVFFGLILLYICFRGIGKIAVSLRRRNAMEAKDITCEIEAKEKKLGEAPGEVIAAISLAMHEMQNDVHDVEDTVLTITRVKRSYSPWSSKIYTLRETPKK